MYQIKYTIYQISYILLKKKSIISYINYNISYNIYIPYIKYNIIYIYNMYIIYKISNIKYNLIYLYNIRRPRPLPRQGRRRRLGPPEVWNLALSSLPTATMASQLRRQRHQSHPPNAQNAFLAPPTPQATSRAFSCRSSLPFARPQTLQTLQTLFWHPQPRRQKTPNAFLGPSFWALPVGHLCSSRPPSTQWQAKCFRDHNVYLSCSSCSYII